MIVKVCIGKLKELIRKILFRIKLHQMDRRWYDSEASSWELFPPSFYYTHTQEEIDRIRKETFAQIEEIIDRFR